MFDPKNIINEAVKGSSSVRSVAEDTILARGKNDAEKKALKEALDSMCEGGEIAWCLHTKKEKQTRQCWETGTPRLLPFSHGRVGRSPDSTASFSI